MVSIIIPSRNERFLAPTVADVLAKATGAIEVLVILDGYWPDPPLPDDPRLRILHRGKAQGMRQGINAAAAIARGEWLMKADAHTMWAEGFDETLTASCDGDWIVVPRRYALDAEAWAWETGNTKYPIDAHYLSFPYERPDDPECGMHGTPWTARREARQDVWLDDEMSSQGSAWFMSAKHFDRIGPMDTTMYGPFVSEFQELGNKTWLGGGAVKVNKRTWYAHLRKGKKYGRGYSLGPSQFGQSRAIADYWMQDRWPGATRSMRWLVEHFWPVPGWPADLDRVFAR